MSGVCRQALSSLRAGIQNSIIIGIIIKSQNFNVIDGTRTRFNNGNRGVWTFTLRDSEHDFINVTVWGRVDVVKQYFTSFHVGTVVEVINAKVSERKIEEKNEMYVPSVTSPFTLTVNESNSLIQYHNSPAVDHYKQFLHLPTKDPSHLLNLQYISVNGASLLNQFVDVLVIVTFVSQAREIITKDGNFLKIREFEVGDGSIEKTISLTLWDSEWIQLAEIWEPRHTILLLEDAQIQLNKKNNKPILTIARKTVIIENPNIPEALSVKCSTHKISQTLSTNSPFAIPNPNKITTWMTIQEITDALNNTPIAENGVRHHFLTAVQAIIAGMNVDSNDESLICEKCAKCKKVIQSDNDSCMNLDCPFGNGTRTPVNVISLDIKVNLKDSTGYLVSCRLRDAAAEEVLGCTGNEFKEMNLKKRQDLKKKFFMKKCDIRLQIFGPTVSFTNSIYNILSITYPPRTNLQFEPLNLDDEINEDILKTLNY